MATEHTTVHATDHTRDQSAKKVSILNGVLRGLRFCETAYLPRPSPYLVVPFGR